MAQEMRFQSIGLWDCQKGGYVDTCHWCISEEKSAGGRLVKLTLPLDEEREGKWEVRASILADGYLEISGRQGMLLSRLMDEFPPPDPDKPAATAKLSGEVMRLLTVAGGTDFRKQSNWVTS